MATEFTYDQLTGVIVPYWNWRSVAVDYALTTAEVLASAREPGEVALKEATATNPIYNSQASFVITGSQTVDQEIAVVRGGSPGHDHSGMKVVWRDEQGNWRGWMDHNVITDIDPENMVAKGATINVGLTASIDDVYCQSNSSIISDRNGGALVVVGLEDTVVVSHYIPADSDLTGQQTIFESEDANDPIGGHIRNGIGGALPVDGYISEDGTATVFALAVEEAGSPSGASTSGYQLWALRADGSARDARYPATSFRTVGMWALPASIGLTASSQVISMKCAADERGNVMVILNVVIDVTAATRLNTLIQLASNNGGLTFDIVGYNATTTLGDEYYANAIDCFYYNGKFALVKSSYSNVTTFSTVKSYQVSSPYVDLFSVEPVIIIEELTSIVRSVSVYTSQDGRAFLLMAAEEDVYLARTSDGGSSWSFYSTGFANRIYADVVDACEVEGRAVVLVGSNLTSSQDTENLLILKCGGFETLTHPRIANTSPSELASYGTDIDGADTAISYIPLALPTVYGLSGWIASTLGTYSETITPGFPWLNLIKGASSQIDYSFFLTDCTYDTGATMACHFEHTSGSYAHALMEVWNGTTKYGIQVRLTSTALQLADFNSGTIKATYSVASGTAVKAKVAYRKGTATLFVLTSDGVWTVVGTGTGWTGVVGPSSTSAKITFGLPGATTATVAKFFFVGAFNFSGGGNQAAFNDDLAVWTSATHAPYGLAGASVPQAGFGVTSLPSGLRLAATGGWAQRGERYDIFVASQYGFEKTLIASPSVGSKIQVDAINSYDIVYSIDTEALSWRHTGDAFGVALVNTDLQYVSVSVSADGTIWDSLGDMNLAQESGLSFTRLGSGGGTLVPGTGNAGTVFYEHDELVGCQVVFNDGTVAEIKGNTAGRWTQDGKGMKIHINYADASPPQIGSLTIYRREMAAIFTGTDLNFKYVKLTFPPMTTKNLEAGIGVQDWAFLGTVLFGTYIPFSNKYSASRSVTLEPNVIQQVTRYGISKTTKIGPATRAIQCAWAEGFDTSESLQDTPGSFISLPSGLDVPVAHRGSGTILEGIKRATEDGTLPLVYVPKIEGTTYSDDYPPVYAFYVRGREALVLAEMLGSVSRDVVLGEENTSEVVRMSSITIKELV